MDATHLYGIRIEFALEAVLNLGDAIPNSDAGDGQVWTVWGLKGETACLRYRDESCVIPRRVDLAGEGPLMVIRRMPGPIVTTEAAVDLVMRWQGGDENALAAILVLHPALREYMRRRDIGLVGLGLGR